jgi:RNA polymerase sigma-70 factor (ECF subfamily)
MGRAGRLAQALLRNREDALDASQVALLSILRSTASFRGESSVECWADRIVVRTALRVARLRRRSETSDTSDCLRMSIPPGGEARVCANQYLNRLPEAQRTALLLRSAFGYSVEEISALTQAPVDTVKDRLKRARRAVHRELGREQTIEGAHPLARVSRQAG